MEVDQQVGFGVGVSACGPGNAELPMQGILSEVTSFCQPYMDKLFSSDRIIMLEGLVQIKNFVIGNNKQKSNFIALGVIPRLKYLIQQDESDALLKTHCAVILGSLAKGIHTDVTNVWDCEILNVLFNGLRQFDLKLYEACIRCIRTIVTLPEKHKLMFNDPSIFPILMKSINLSMTVQECTCEILMNCCKTEKQQNIINTNNAIQHVAGLLTSSITRVKVKAMRAICAMCYENVQVGQSLMNVKISNKPVVETLTLMTSRSETVEIQLHSAKALTYLYRSGVEGIDKDTIYKKVLPCLVRMCDSKRNIDERVVGAVTVACLIEPEPELQRIALICEHFPQKLACYFSNPAAGDTNSASDMKRFNYELSRMDDMLEAVFLAYSSLLSNDEDMRDLVVTESLVRHVVQGLGNECTAVRVAALLCLLSLSRSVQILRTFFEDHEVWKGVLKILQKKESDNLAADHELVTASAILCNLMLDFSPCKWMLIEAKVLDMLKAWCRNDSCLNLQRNGIWGLFNTTFQASEDLKLKVMWLLDPDTLFMLLTCSDSYVIKKTLGVLFNVLANTEHVDKIMTLHGDTIMQACAVAIESTSTTARVSSAEEIHTHALCVLSCVAAGDEAKTVQKYLHDNDHFMKKLVEYTGSSNDELQRAAIDCVWKLCCGSASTVSERRAKLKELGVVERLQRYNTDNASEKIKETLAVLQS